MPHRSPNPKHWLLERTFRKQEGRRTLVILLPTYYNPDALGVRKKVEPEKWRATMVEIERFFSGYQQMHINGWNSEDNVKDDLYRFDFDLIVTPAKVAAILRWKHVLEHRFEQRSIYMKFSERVFWL